MEQGGLVEVSQAYTQFDFQRAQPTQLTEAETEVIKPIKRRFRCVHQLFHDHGTGSSSKIFWMTGSLVFSSALGS
jgi:hypothetical protein